MKLLVTGAWQASLEELESIRQLGHEIVFLQQEKDPLPCPYKDIEGCICNGLFLYHPIEKFRSLRYIQLTSAGFDRVPMEYVKAHNIEIYNARGVYSIPMAEFAVCGVLQLYKQSRFFYDSQKEHKWIKHRSLLELHGKTVCIVGCGSVGTECAKRFKAFGCEIVGVDVVPYDSEIYNRMAELEKLDAELAQGDVVVLTFPLTGETSKLFNKRRFDAMKDNAVLVNIARGAIVEMEALIEALQVKLFGAVLDVFESEPLPEGSPLWNMGNVILTPHNSFASENNKKRLMKIITNNFIKEYI